MTARDAGKAPGGRGFGTLAVHGPGRTEGGRTEGGRGAGDGETRSGEPHAPPIVQTSAFSFADTASALAAFRGSGEFVYTRLGNPTVRELERAVAALEAYPAPGAGAGPSPGPEEPDARFFSSGMAAISAVALGIAGGGRLVCQDGIYGTTVAHMEGLGRYGIDVDFVPVGDLDAIRAAVEADPAPALVYVETPANPLLQVTDLRAAAEIAHQAGARLAVDSTFATPALQRPLAWGADFSIHSTTKFIGGHGAALGGVVTGTREAVESLVDPVRKFFGGAPDPFAAWLTLLGLRTLEVRMERHVANAGRLASFLEGHPRVLRVFRADRSAAPAGQLRDPGPMLSFEVEGGRDAALSVIDGLEIAVLAPTLGTLDTLVQHPYTMSHGLLPEERRRALGIAPGIVRVSVGLEDPEDLTADFGRALEAT